jgi:hypothetical protein
MGRQIFSRREVQTAKTQKNNWDQTKTDLILIIQAKSKNKIGLIRQG